jgi:hypothetical protein
MWVIVHKMTTGIGIGTDNPDIAEIRNKVF